MSSFKAFLIFIPLFIVSQLAISQSFSTQTGGHCFTLNVPDYLTKTYELNDAASLQYMNVSKEAYVIVIDDAKDQLEGLGMKFVDAADFLNNFTADYQLEVENRKTGEVKTFEANKNQHAQVELSWTSDETEFYMLITSVETSKHFYKILCWTVGDYKSDLKPDYLKVASSLED